MYEGYWVGELGKESGFFNCGVIVINDGDVFVGEEEFVIGGVLWYVVFG